MVTPISGSYADSLAQLGIKSGLDAQDERWKAERDSKIKQLLMGKELEAAKQQFDELNPMVDVKDAKGNVIGQKRDYKVGVHVGQVGFNPQNDDLLRAITQKGVEQDRADTKLKDLGQRIESVGATNAMPAIANLEGATKTIDPKTGQPIGGMITNPDYKAKFAGGILNILPSKLPFTEKSILPVYEKLGIAPKGAQEELQYAQRLMNIDTKNFAGSAVSLHEEGRKLVERGMAVGGDPRDITRGVQMMAQAVQSQMGNISASTPPEVVARYKAQGGKMGLEDFFKPQSSATDSPQTAQDPDIAKYAKDNGMTYEAAAAHISKYQGKK